MKNLFKSMWFWVISLHLIMILGWFLIYNIAGKAVKSDLPFFADAIREEALTEPNKNIFTITLINKTDQATSYTLSSKCRHEIKLDHPDSIQLQKYGTTKIKVIATSAKIFTTPQELAFQITTKDRKQTIIKAQYSSVKNKAKDPK